jgi:hypothetical protein
MSTKRTPTPNNSGRELRELPGPGGASLLEVWDTDARGKLSALVVSCYVEPNETPAEAVAGLLAEFLHPFGAAWDSPEQYGKELDAVKWLAEFHGIDPEGSK